MVETSPILRTILIPLQRGQVILPSATLVEVLPYSPPEPSPETPDWVLGSLSWRQGRVPIISMDTLVHGDLPEFGARSRIAVLRSLGEAAGIEHYAILIQAVPRLVTLERKLITLDPTAEEREGVMTSVKVASQAAYIPDLGHIERVLSPAFAIQEIETDVGTVA